VNTSKIKGIKEVKLNEDNTQIEILFEELQNGTLKEGTIVLSGAGAVKVLQPV
jgi:hypothetical protein